MEIMLPGSTVTSPLVELGKVICINNDRTKPHYITLLNISSEAHGKSYGRYLGLFH